MSKTSPSANARFRESSHMGFGEAAVRDRCLRVGAHPAGDANGSDRDHFAMTAAVLGRPRSTIILGRRRTKTLQFLAFGHDHFMTAAVLRCPPQSVIILRW